MDYLFVYGSLRSSYDNKWALMLRAAADLVGPVTVQGAVTQIGQWPGFIPGAEGEVHGELYRLHTPAETLAALDEYEGPDYARVLVEVSTGQTAWVWRAAR